MDLEKDRLTFIKGHITTQETREKISNSLLGNIPWNKGKKLSDLHKKRLSDAKQNQCGKNNPFYGKHHTLDTKHRLRLANIGKKINFRFKNTKPERYLQTILYSRGIKFQTHKEILGHPDIFIEPDLCIFVDGDYWHKLPKAIERDGIVNRELKKRGYKVIRLWASEIFDDLTECLNEIENWQEYWKNI